MQAPLSLELVSVMILSRVVTNILRIVLKNMTVQVLQTVNAAPCAVDLPSLLMADSWPTYEMRVA